VICQSGGSRFYNKKRHFSKNRLVGKIEHTYVMVTETEETSNANNLYGRGSSILGFTGGRICAD
jgi:hypothetical protein